jgi:hypothetical protein
MSSGASGSTASNTFAKLYAAVTGTSGPQGGGRRARNQRGRFLSGKKAARITLKKRESRASTLGTKAQVFHGTAKRTSGGLTRKDLMKTKKGRIVSKRKHAAGKVALRRLKAAGYSAKKGTFKLFRK